MEPNPSSPKIGLSNKIKVPIIILTFITLCAFGALFMKMAFSVSSSESKLDSQQYLRDVGDKLKSNNLNEQAIDQYIKYFDQTKAGTLSRFTVAHTIGELYIELNNCREALSWLFLAETAGPTYQRSDELKNNIDKCLTQVHSQKPINLTR